MLGLKDVKFITSSGKLKSAKNAAKYGHRIEDFLDFVYFKEEVLKKYESNKDYKIGDDGTVLFGHKWGLFRGVHRVSKGFLAVHLGDLGEAFPQKELEHWRKYNVKPPKIKTPNYYTDFRDTIQRTLNFMKNTNERVKHHLDKFYWDIEIKNKNIFLMENLEDTLNHLRKIINKKTTLDDFQSRVIFFNILILESINYKMLSDFLKKLDKKLLYSYDNIGLIEISEQYIVENTPDALKSTLAKSIVPLKSLALLRRFLLISKLNVDIINSLQIKTKKELKNKHPIIYKKSVDEFLRFYKYKMFGKNFRNKDYFLQLESSIENETKSIKLLNNFRNESAAHGFNEKSYKKFLTELGFEGSTKDFSVVYETLVSRVGYDIEHIYFNLITSDPPIIDYTETYIKDALVSLEKNNMYESSFEEIASYLNDFPELIEVIDKGLRNLCKKKLNDAKFIIQLGCFIESASYAIKDRSQDFIDLIVIGYKYEKPLSLAHISHIIKNSQNISP